MRNFYIFLCWLICLQPLRAQTVPENSGGYFEGVITYRLLIEAKNPTLSTRNLQAMFGDTMKLFLKDNNYKMVFSGSYAREILYAGKENKHFISLGPVDSLMWRYCNENASSVIYVQSAENTDLVLDYACNSYFIQTDWGFTTYYFSPQLKLNPKQYNQHVFNNFNVYVKHARAPYLKYVYTGPSFKLTLVAVNIEQQALDLAVFDPVWKPVAINDVTEVEEAVETDEEPGTEIVTEVEPDTDTVTK